METTILLDTNSLLWLLEDNENLGPAAHRSLDIADAVYASSISIVEIRIKEMRGKLTVPGDLVALVRSSGVRELTYSDEDADALGGFPHLARHDPFDRLLIAQASARRLTLLTSDAVLIELAGDLTQDARL